MAEVAGYILRITTEEWANQVFSLAIYYTNARRKWKPGQTAFLVHKTKVGDAIIGYGEIGNICGLEVLSEEEKRQCEKLGWKEAIEFRYIIRFDRPLLVRETILKDLKLRGRSLHAFPMNGEQVKVILSQAERIQSE
jgi:hypothetical protein